MQGGRIIASGKTGRAWKSGVHLHIDLKQRRLRNVCCEVANVSLSCQGERVAPNAFKYIAAETAKWAKVIKFAGIQVK